MEQLTINIYDAISQMRILNGNIPAHSKHGPPVNFFAPKGKAKFWVKQNTPVFGFFFYHILDKVVCPHLASIFEMPIVHPTTAEKVDELLAATVELIPLRSTGRATHE